MSKQPDLPKNSINSAIVGLQDTLRNLQQQWPCLQKDATANTKQPNGKRKKKISEKSTMIS